MLLKRHLTLPDPHGCCSKMLLGAMSRRFGDSVSGVFTPVLVKHSKSFSDVHRMQRAGKFQKSLS